MKASPRLKLDENCNNIVLQKKPDWAMDKDGNKTKAGGEAGAGAANSADSAADSAPSAEAVESDAAAADAAADVINADAGQASL